MLARSKNNSTKIVHITGMRSRSNLSSTLYLVADQGGRLTVSSLSSVEQQQVANVQRRKCKQTRKAMYLVKRWRKAALLGAFFGVLSTAIPPKRLAALTIFPIKSSSCISATAAKSLTNLQAQRSINSNSNSRRQVIYPPIQESPIYTVINEFLGRFSRFVMPAGKSKGVIVAFILCLDETPP